MVDFVDDTGFVVVASSSDVMEKSISICIKAKREVEAEAGEEGEEKRNTSVSTSVVCRCHRRRSCSPLINQSINGLKDFSFRPWPSFETLELTLSRSKTVYVGSRPRKLVKVNVMLMMAIVEGGGCRRD